MKKLSFLMAAILVLSSLCVFNVGAAEVDVWDGTADMSWYSMDKTEFLITTPEQLAGVAQMSSMGVNFEGQTIKLGADIALNTGNAATWAMKRIDETKYDSEITGGTAPANMWTPIGCDMAPFAGTFDGQGHTISGLYYFGKETSNTKVGLFGIVCGVSEDQKAVIKNVTILNSYINGYHSVGSIVGFADAFVTVEGCYSEAILDSTYFEQKYEGKDHGAANVLIGGIVGAIAKAPFDLLINNCAYKGDIYCYQGNNIGGITGGHNSGEAMDCNAKISNCSFIGSIIADQRLGGIIGRYAAGELYIENCYVDAKIQCMRSENYGGAIGGLRGSAATWALITNFYYDGEFYGKTGDPVGARLGAFEEGSGDAPYGVLADGSTFYTPLDDKSTEPCLNDKKVHESEGVLVPDGNTIDPFVAALDTTLWGTKDGVPFLKTLTYVPGTVPPQETLPEPETTVAPETTAAPADTTAAPVETTAAPADTTAAPVGTTVASVETTAAPADTTAAPADTTAAPAEGGCGSFVGGGMLVVTAILGSAWVSKRR